MDEIAQFVERIVSYRDPDLAGHHQRLGEHAENFALHLGYSNEQTATFKTGAEIHDIGKMAIPEHILNKPSRLTPAEMMLIKQHTNIGHEIIYPLGLKQCVRDTVLFHHENYDGTGYPAGIGGNEIPIFGRMMRICDTFDALTEDRPYHKGVSCDDTLKILQRDQRFFDFELLNEFIGMIERLENIRASLDE
ncbi:HD domain-containing phosphohydrolase [Haliea sp. E1-2-M8]|uniref:HD-GYP domain-containing protein n=1 Tax=Haliea sp. E1-2-M8 TaxID=3064706 RepID=UPI002715DA58|nr:HD domain-containing phosphohydrolase [Haliea sp. E1-2-M8]MDO8863835.1 HD domain-containing phosphohydrolase [Haliea sp. E1-2-M8]